MGEAARPPRAAEGPGPGLSFVGAVVAVMAAGAFGSVATPLASAFAPVAHGSDYLYVWLALGAAAAAVALKIGLGLFGYALSYLAAFVALIVGDSVSSVLPRLAFTHAGTAMPLLGPVGLVFGLPGLALSAWIVQQSASAA